MKGLSICFTVLLLVLAHWLALHLKRTGALPAQSRSDPDFTASTRAVAALGYVTPAGTPLNL